MKRIHQFIKTNFSLLLIVFLYLQPFLDVITAIFLEVFHIHFTIGMIFRFLFLLFVLYSVVFIFQKKRCLVYYVLVLLYSICYMVMLYSTGGDSFLFSELQMLLKFFYFPLLLTSFYFIKDSIVISEKIIIRLFCIYLLFLFIPTLTHTGFQSYDVTKGGSIGWFYSANEISAIMAILFPIFISSFSNFKYKFYKILFLIIYLVVMLTIGTKVPLLAFFLTLFFIFMYMLICWIREKRYQWIMALMAGIVVIITSAILIIPKTTFYKNIQVHLDFLGVNHITDVFSSIHLIDHFIFSERVTFLEGKSISYDNAPLIKKVLGLGIHDEEDLSKMIEMDYYDVFYSTGLVGCLLFFIPYLYILYQIYKSLKTKKFNFIRYMNVVSLILILLLSLFSGHVITSPSVSIYCIIILFFNLSNKIVCT